MKACHTMGLNSYPMELDKNNSQMVWDSNSHLVSDRDNFRYQESDKSIQCRVLDKYMMALDSNRCLVLDKCNQSLALDMYKHHQALDKDSYLR